MGWGPAGHCSRPVSSPASPHRGDQRQGRRRLIDAEPCAIHGRKLASGMGGVGPRKRREGEAVRVCLTDLCGQEDLRVGLIQ